MDCAPIDTSAWQNLYSRALYQRNFGCQGGIQQRKEGSNNIPLEDAIYLGLYFPEPIQMLVNSKQTQYSSLYQINDTGLLLLFEEPCEEQI